MSYNMSFKRPEFFLSSSFCVILFCLLPFQKNMEKYFGDVNGRKMRKSIPNFGLEYVGEGRVK